MIPGNPVLNIDQHELRFSSIAQSYFSSSLGKNKLVIRMQIDQTIFLYEYWFFSLAHGHTIIIIYLNSTLQNYTGPLNYSANSCNHSFWGKYVSRTCCKCHSIWNVVHNWMYGKKWRDWCFQILWELSFEIYFSFRRHSLYMFACGMCLCFPHQS